MIDIYCHLHTPLNIEDDNKYFIPPIAFDSVLYVINEKNLFDSLAKIGYYQECIKFIRENGYENIAKWLSKKKLLNEWFLEGMSKYTIENVNYKQIQNYKYFKKNNFNKPVINEEYFINIFKNLVLYTYIKDDKDNFNEKVENVLSSIESEFLSIIEPKNLKSRKVFYKKNIFKILLDEFLSDHNYFLDEKLQEINNINFSCETLLNPQDLYVYKITGINGYKDCNFKMTNISYRECIRENSFIKLNASLLSRYSDDSYLKYLLEQLKIYSKIFVDDKVDFGVAHLKKIMGYEEKLLSYSEKRKLENILNQNNEYKSSNIGLLQKTQIIISETEDHILSQYLSLKEQTNICMATEDEMLMSIISMNLNKENLEKLNNYIFGQQNYVETKLVKLRFRNRNLPYSAYGFASINF